MTFVFNLSRGEERWYDLPPDDAVKAAFLQSRGNNNTWDYENVGVDFVIGKKTIACGDWCALLNGKG